MSQTKAAEPRLNPRTLEGRIEIRQLVYAARRRHWLHITRPTHEAQPPRRKPR